MTPEENLEKFKATYNLLTQGEISLQTFEEVRTLIKGFNRRVDEKLESISGLIAKAQMIQDKDLLGMSEEALGQLPEETEEQKKRKKFLLFLFRNINELRSEVSRVIKELESTESAKGQKTSHSGVSLFGKLFATAKGPLGIITISAVALVAAAKLLIPPSVDIQITNQGCSPVNANINLPVPLPGIKLPQSPILSGGQATARVPGLTVAVDGSNAGLVGISILGYSRQFALKGGENFIFDGTPIIGGMNTFVLKDRPQHELIIQCE